MNLKTIVILMLFLTTGINFFAQTPANLEIIKNLIDVSVQKIQSSSLNSGDEIYLGFSSPENFSTLKFDVINSFTKNGISIRSEKNEAQFEINYSISNTGVIYTDTFRDGLLGEYLVIRKSFLEGNYTISERGKKLEPFEFEETFIDTVNYDDLEEIEIGAYPFTKGTPRDEPFFSSLLEPVIAIGATAVAVYLFFSVRNK